MAHGKFEKRPEPKKARPVSGGKKKSSTNQILMRVLIGVLSVLLVLMIVAAAAMNYVLGKIGRYDAQDDATQATLSMEELYAADETVEGQETLETMDADSVVWDDVKKMEGEHIINILLIGQDARAGEGRARSDTMILVSLNQETNSIQLTSFMRDMYVQIPGYYDNRINAAFALGGPELLDATLEKNFGIQVDGNVEVNFEAFADVIDVLGGVDIEIDSEEANYMVARGVSCSAGMNHFNGEEALIYARMRYVSGSDYSRTERQRRLITSVINSLKDSSITDVLNLINQVLPLVTTDLTDSKIISYATAGLSALAGGGEIQSTRIPADDAHYNAMISGMAVLVPDLAMCQEDLQEFIYGGE